MDDLSVIQWVAGGTAALVFAGMGHLLSRIISIERRQADVIDNIRRDNAESMKDLWEARDKDRAQREKDQEAMMTFRTYVLTHLATKDDFNALETRITGAVRMIVNERTRKGDIDGRV